MVIYYIQAHCTKKNTRSLKKSMPGKDSKIFSDNRGKGRVLTCFIFQGEFVYDGEFRQEAGPAIF